MRTVKHKIMTYLSTFGIALTLWGCAGKEQQSTFDSHGSNHPKSAQVGEAKRRTVLSRSSLSDLQRAEQKAKVRRVAAWYGARESMEVCEFFNFIKEYPHSEEAIEAKRHLELLYGKNWAENFVLVDRCKKLARGYYQRQNHWRAARAKLNKLELERDWNLAQSANTSGAFREFLRKHPQSKYSPVAKKRVEALELEPDWKSAQNANTSGAFREFLRKHPESKYSAEAKKCREAALFSEAVDAGIDEAILVLVKKLEGGSLTVETIEKLKGHKSVKKGIIPWSTLPTVYAGEATHDGESYECGIDMRAFSVSPRAALYDKSLEVGSKRYFKPDLTILVFHDLTSFDGYLAKGRALVTSKGLDFDSLSFDDSIVLREVLPITPTAKLLALTESMNAGDAARVGELAKGGADVNARNKDGTTALIVAIDKGYTDVVKALLEFGADVNLPDKKKGYTPLFFATDFGNLDVVRILLGAGADANARANDGHGPLSVAWDHPDIVKALLEAGADVNLKGKHDGGTAIFVAAMANNLEVVNIMVEAGADVNACANKGQTPLFMAWGDPDITKALLEAGADVNVQSHNGDTALIRAADNGDPDVIKALLEAGANVNVQSQNGDTALFLAAAYGHPNIVKILLEAGADANTKGHVAGKDYTSLDIAKELGYAEVVKILEKNSKKQ